MNPHKEKLSYLCRLCAIKITPKRGYVTPKPCSAYKDVLRAVYGILADEDPEVYPRQLCLKCKAKLDRINAGGSPSSTEVAKFVPHDNECRICKVASYKISNITNIDQEMLKCGLRRYLHTDNKQLIYSKQVLELSGLITSYSFHINGDISWSVFALNQKLDLKNTVLSNLPAKANNDNIHQFVNKFKSLRICTGNRDFKDVLDRRVDFKDPFPSATGGTAAWVESSKGNSRLVKDDFDVVRDLNCTVVVTEGSCCSSCLSYRKKLLKYRDRTVEMESNALKCEDSSHVNFRYLTIDEMEKRAHGLAISKKSALAKVAQYSRTIDKLLSEDGVSVSSDQHSLFKDVVNKNMPTFEEGSPQWLLWQQQAEQASKSNKAMRWHPLIIRWCLSIYHTSPAAYRQLASKGNKLIVLPHVNTLKKYINFTDPVTGFNPDILDRLIEDSKIYGIEDFKKNVSLIYDEIKIKSGLVFKRSTGKLVGFTEMGELNEEIREFQSNCDDKKSSFERSFASYVNVFMVRGICSNLCYTFGYHASIGFTAAQLIPLVWEANHVLESIGFKVRAWVCDGASPNRKCFKVNGVGAAGNWMWSLFDPQRKVYFMSDVPHLLKTTRNNIENSHANLNSRNLHVNHQDISWLHIVSVYEWDLGMNRAALGLRKLNKLREEHIKMSPRNRMRVKLAAQVISNSVVEALRLQNLHDTHATIAFLELFDRTFDCLNVMSQKRDKPDRLPYRNEDDPRFEFLESVLTYLDEWRNHANATIGMSQEEKNKLCLSYQTDKGWHMTIKSFIELTKLLLSEGAPYILSEKFSQDPLEEHFARHRRSAGCNDNPTLAQFGQQEVALNIIKSDLISDLRGNTRGRPQNRAPLDITDMRLPKKRPRN